MADEQRPGRALIEVTPHMMERLRDPRTVLGLVLVAAGAVAVIVGYFGVSGTLDPGKQLPYIISGGIGGVFLLGCGATLIFSGDLAETRRELEETRNRLDELHRQVALLVERSEANPATDSTATLPAQAGGTAAIGATVAKSNGANGAKRSEAAETDGRPRARRPGGAAVEDV